MSFSEPNYNKVATLCHFDGPNNSTDISDVFGVSYYLQGTNGKLSTTQAKFGSTSFFCNTTGYLYIPYFQINEDYTIEFFYYYLGGGAQGILYAPLSAIGALNIQLFTSKLTMFGSSLGASYDFNLTGTTTLTTSNWYHIAVSKSGTSVKLFLNGTLELTGTLSSINQPISYFYFGYSSGGYLNQGYLDELRITKGVSLYSSNFTAPSQAFSSWTKYFNILINSRLPNVLSYYPLSESSGSSLSDLITLYPLTISGSPSFSQTALATWTDDTSISFSGDSASGTFANLNGLTSFSSVFFIKTSTTNQTILSKSGVFSISLDSSGYVVFTIGGSSLTSSSIVTDNVTHMIVCSFQNYRLLIYNDGVVSNSLEGSFSIVDNNTQPLVIGPFTGILDEVYLMNYSLKGNEPLFWYNLALSINPTKYFLNDSVLFLNDENLPSNVRYIINPTKYSLLDTYYSSNFNNVSYTLASLVTIDGVITLGGIPSSREVILMELYNKDIVRTTWSNPSTGYYSFSDVKYLVDYMVFCEDYETGNQASKKVIIGVPTNLDPLLGSSTSSPITSQFSGYISSFGIFKVSTVEQSLIDNLFYSSNILGSFKIEGETYINNVKTQDISVLLLDSSYNKIKSTISDSLGNFSFLNIHYASYYILTTVDSLTNVIKGPILPTPM